MTAETTNTTDTDTTTAAGKAPAKRRNVRQPQDRQPKAAQQAEANEDTTVTVTVRGIEVTFDRVDLDDYDILEHLGAGNYPRGGPLLFGKDQWKGILDELRDKDTGKLKMSDVDAFVNEVFEAAGAGNS